MAILTVHTQIEGISTIPWDTLPCNISNPQRHYYNICQKQKRGKCTNEESKLGNNSWKVFLKDEGDSTIPKKNFQMQSGILRQNVALQEISIQHFFQTIFAELASSLLGLRQMRCQPTALCGRAARIHRCHPLETTWLAMCGIAATPQVPQGSMEKWSSFIASEFF